MSARRIGYDLNGRLLTSPTRRIRSDICYVTDKVEVFGSGVDSGFIVNAGYFDAEEAVALIDSRALRPGQMSWRAQPRSRGAELSRVSVSQDKLSECRYDDNGNLLVTFRSMDDQSIVEVKVYLPGEDACAFVGMSDGFSQLDLVIVS